MLVGIFVAAHAMQGMSTGKNKDHYNKVFDTEETDVAKFWDSLNTGRSWILGHKKQYATKVDVGSLAVDQGFMSPNFRWDCTNTKFKDLKRVQQRIIIACFKCKDEMHSIISIRALANNMFSDAPNLFKIK